MTGSDQGMYPPMSDVLRKMEIRLMEGYSADNLRPAPDLVVVGNVIRKTNPEAMELERNGIPFISMPQALRSYFAADKTRIVVTGTHGKTTVSSMIAWILFSEGLDPGFMIGGVTENFQSNYRLGRGDAFVLEGDEYDTAYFDKRPKFLHYEPHIGVITSCEFDHGDIYRDLQHVQGEFASFAGAAPEYGRIIYRGGDPVVAEVVSNAKAHIESYGDSPDYDWSVEKVEEAPQGITARFTNSGGPPALGTIPVMGYHNLLNGLAAVAVASKLGIEPERAVRALEGFKGVKRRQQIVADENGVTIIDDFAHHPTEVECTCRAIRARYPSRRLVTVFEPRTNTSRRSTFQSAYERAFVGSDLVVLREPRDVDGIPEGDRFSSKRLAGSIRKLGVPAEAFDSGDEIFSYLTSSVRSGDVVLFMSNGSFDRLCPRLAEATRKSAS